MPAVKPAFPRLRRGHPLARGLSRAWLLGEGSGDKALDLSGNDAHGTTSASNLWAGGQSGWALGCAGGAHADLPLPAVASADDYALVITHRPTTWTSGFTTLLDDASRVWTLFVDTGGNNAGFG